MRTRITTDESGRVTLEYDDLLTLEDDKRIVREFTCPLDGGYVRERIRDDWKQVCDDLAHMGSTLMCKSRADLPDLIRREYRKMRRWQKRELAYLAEGAKLAGIIQQRRQR